MVARNPPPANRLSTNSPESAALLEWYDRSRRRLPWRAEPGQAADAYGVWLSEIMLQQTTVQAVKEYYLRFLSLWPDVRSLAAAEDGAVMAAWAGLGYYSRARNLLACARKVVSDHGGRFPATEDGLRSLPGIGPYTAAAIAAIAFGRRAVVVDGNVERVVSRYFAISEPLPAAKPAICTATDALTPDERAGDFAQAMMDLGATICSPRRPACVLCPLTENCMARRQGIAEMLPAKAPKAVRPVRRGAAFVAVDASGAVLACTRPPKGLLGGMTGVPGSEWIVEAPLPKLPQGAPFLANWWLTGTMTHVFTHFELHLAVFRADIARMSAPQGHFWIAKADIGAAAFPTAYRKVLAAAGLEEPRA